MSITEDSYYILLAPMTGNINYINPQERKY